MKNRRFTFRQSIENQQDKRIQHRRRIILPENTTTIDLVYDEEGKLEFLDIQYVKKEPYEL